MRRSRAAIPLLACLLAALLLAACGDDDDPPGDPAVADPTPGAADDATTPEPTPTATPGDTPTPTPTSPPLPDGPAEPEPVAAVPAFDHTVFDRPVDAGPWPPGGTGAMYVVEQQGVIYQVDEGGSDVLLDMTAQVGTGGNEEGLLSVALDPGFEENRYVWLYYSGAGGAARTVLSRMQASEDGTSIDLGSELVVLEVEQPYRNHNGGTVRFGPDGMLYLGIGDGGSGGDPHGHGQNPTTLLGTIVRLDVSGASASEPYRVPADNPFVDEPGALDEIFAYGLRNPWRMDFDPVTGALWVGDVGQEEVEEISIAEAGDNLGWAIMEGDQCYPPGVDCDSEGLRMPVVTYANTGARCSVTGGIISRDASVPELTNAYLFSDWCSGEIWGVNADHPGEPRIVAEGLGMVTSFTTGPDGEIYVLAFERPLQQLVSP